MYSIKPHYQNECRVATVARYISFAVVRVVTYNKHECMICWLAVVGVMMIRPHNDVSLLLFSFLLTFVFVFSFVFFF